MNKHPSIFYKMLKWASFIVRLILLHIVRILIPLIILVPQVLLILLYTSLIIMSPLIPIYVFFQGQIIIDMVGVVKFHIFLIIIFIFVMFALLRYSHTKDSHVLSIVVTGLFSVAIIMLYIPIYRNTGLETLEGNTQGKIIIIKDFWPSFYFSIVTWTTLGYGDIAPTKSARFPAAAEAFMGYTFMGVFVSVIVAHLNSKIKRKQHTTENDENGYIIKEE